MRNAVLLLVVIVVCIVINVNCYKKLSLTMKWSFSSAQQGIPGMPSSGGGSIQDAGVIGNEGEYYFQASRPAKLKAPVESVGKPKVVPLFPSPSNVLIPLGTEMLNVFEMKHRQLLNDVGNGVFAFSYVAKQEQKLALVGTLAKVKSRKILDDGRSVCVIEGIERFYIQEVIKEKPYLKAKVQSFTDYTENPSLLDVLENKIFDEVRCNLKIMELLLPNKNYSISPHILEYRPNLVVKGTRTVTTLKDPLELERRAKFSFAVMDMLQISHATKLMLLQEHVIEKRFARLLKILEKCSVYLMDELRSRGILTEQGIRQLKEDALNDNDKLIIPTNPNAWNAENYDDEKNTWVLQPILM